MANKSSARRTFELLWGLREQPTRGPKPSLSVEQIVRVAIEIADAEGLGAVSMRRVAERLGVTTMSLYRYVPSKNDLLELMLDAIASPWPDPAEMPDNWRDALHLWAHRNMAVYREHPWLIEYAFSHPPFGPNNIRWMEYALQAMLPTGLSPDDMMGVLIILTGYVRSEASQEFALRQGARTTGVEPEEWGQVYAEMLRRVINDVDFPALARVVAAGVFDDGDEGPDEDFEYGLRFVLDGVEALIKSRQREGAESPAARSST